MSVKRAQKSQKRKQKKKLQEKKKQLLASKAEAMVGRLDLDRTTPPDQFYLTLMSKDVPESQWHPDDADFIRQYIHDLHESTGEHCSVKRRPDGTLTILGEPVAEGFEDTDLFSEPANESDEFLPVLRERLRDHVRTFPAAKSAIENLTEGFVLFIQTAEVTTYATLPIEDFGLLVPDNERAYLSEYLKEHSHLILIGYQEDDSPLMTFAYDHDELPGTPSKLAIPEPGLYVSDREDMRIVVEAVRGESPDDSYLVEFVNESDRDDYSAMSYELDKEEWESFVKEHNLIPG